ncbi:uncharacterized protein LOC143660720 isoform X2 [Tamandua tetradactyla]|uniref:uncharacterized protein LOC143660720 isoform X2 n=1 Tax=Tamandua tetradactyla TaxID=48850 RepID=UPI0040549304
MGTASAASISAKLRHRRTELRWLHVVLLCWKWGRGRRRLKSEALRAGGAQRVWGGRRKMKKTDELFMEQNKPLNRLGKATEDFKECNDTRQLNFRRFYLDKFSLYWQSFVATV